MFKLSPEAKEIAEKVLQHIIDHPEEHDQSTWHCGTTKCIGGWLSHAYTTSLQYLKRYDIWHRPRCTSERAFAALGIYSSNEDWGYGDKYRARNDLYEIFGIMDEDKAIGAFKDWISKYS